MIFHLDDIPGPVLGLVFLLSALLVFLYVILVWVLIMRALLGRCGGAKDLEAQRIFVWDVQYSPIKTSSYFDFSRPLSLRLRHPRMGVHHGDSPWRGWGWERGGAKLFSEIFAQDQFILTCLRKYFFDIYSLFQSGQFCKFYYKTADFIHLLLNFEIAAGHLFHSDFLFFAIPTNVWFMWCINMIFWKQKPTNKVYIRIPLVV